MRLQATSYANLKTRTEEIQATSLLNWTSSVHLTLCTDLRCFPAAAVPLVPQTYSQCSPRQLGLARMWSCRGVQQDDPLGSILYALDIDPVIQNLQSLFNVWFLDDDTFAGPLDAVVADLRQWGGFGINYYMSPPLHEPW